MAIKHLFGRGIGFTDALPSWVVTRGYGDLSAGGGAYDPDGYEFTPPTGISWDAINRRPSGGVMLTNYAPPHPLTANWPGTDHICTTQAQVDTALATCVDDDMITIDVGLVLQTRGGYAGAITLRSRGAGSGYVWIRPSTWASLPPYLYGDAVSNWDKYARVLAAQGLFFRLETIHTNITCTSFANGAARYWITGFEAYPGAGYAAADFYNSLVAVDALNAGSSQTSEVNAPHDIVLDRFYVHNRLASPILVQAGVVLNGVRCAALHGVVDVSEYVSPVENQAVHIYNTPGPVAVLGCHLRGITEPLFVGGADPGIVGSNPSDLDFRYNWIEVPDELAGVTSTKNLYEQKAGIRTCVFGNELEGAYLGGQVNSLVLKSVNQDGGNTTCELRDVFVGYNRWRKINTGWLVVAKQPETGKADAGVSRIQVGHNLVERGDLPPGAPGTITGNRFFTYFVNSADGHNGAASVHVSRNSGSMPTGAHIQFASDPVGTGWTDFQCSDNVNDIVGQYGLAFGSALGTNATGLNAYVGSGQWRVQGNVTTATTPMETLAATNTGTAQQIYTDAAGGDYTINPAATDIPANKGPDLALVLQHTANVRGSNVTVGANTIPSVVTGGFGFSLGMKMVPTAGFLSADTPEAPPLGAFISQYTTGYGYD